MCGCAEEQPGSLPLTVVSVGRRSRGRARPRPSGRWCRRRWRCGARTATPRRRSPTSAGRRASRSALFYFYFPGQGGRAVRGRRPVDSGCAQDRASGVARGRLRRSTPSSPRRCAASNARWPATRANSSSRRFSRATATSTASSPATVPSTPTPTCSASCSPRRSPTASSRHTSTSPTCRDLAQMLVSEGVRHWALGAFGKRSFADVVTADITALIAGFNQKP